MAKICTSNKKMKQGTEADNQHVLEMDHGVRAWGGGGGGDEDSERVR